MSINTEAIERLTGRKLGPYQRIKLSRCKPNDWNMNRLPADMKVKLKAGIKMLWEKVGSLPPIVVRPMPGEAGYFQIIDGFHRWEILVEGETIDVQKIDAYVLDVDTPTAMILTDTLNYLRGDPDLAAKADYYQRLNNEFHMPPTEMARYVPDTAESITNILDAYDLKVTHIEVEDPNTTDKSDKDDDSDVFVDVKFGMSKGQAEVVEAEIARISKLLKGKNIRGRALEFMAVNSSHTPDENLMGEGGMDDDVRTSTDRRSSRVAQLTDKLQEARLPKVIRNRRKALKRELRTQKDDES